MLEELVNAVEEVRHKEAVCRGTMGMVSHEVRDVRLVSYFSHTLKNGCSLGQALAHML